MPFPSAKTLTIIRGYNIPNRIKISSAALLMLCPTDGEEPFSSVVNKFWHKRRVDQFSDYVFSDSKGERQFAHDLDEASEVVVYAKLPRTFQIPTPVGNYAPDWAIAMKKNDVKHIFFIAETKGSMSSMDLSAIERAKIDCAEKLFNSISTANVKYHKVAIYQDLMMV